LLDLSLTPDSAPLMACLAGVMPSIRAAMARAARAYPEGRKSLPDAVNEVAQRENVPLTSKGGKTVTLEQLNKWLQPSDREHEPGLRAILCFCIALHDFSPLEPIWKACGLAVVPADEVRYLAYGKSCDALERAKVEHRKQKARL
jgi:hypothetical protein